MTYLKWLLKAAPNVTVYNIESNFGKNFISQIICDGDVVLSSNTPISGPSPTWSFAGFIPLQSLENFLNQQVFTFRILCCDIVVFEILVDLKQFCEYSGDMMQLNFPSRSIIFEFGDYILLDAQVAELLRIQFTEVRQFAEETIFFEADPIKLGAFKKQIESNLGNKFSSLKTVRNDKIVILNKARSLLSALEKELLELDSAVVTASHILDQSTKMCTEINEQYAAVDSTLVLLNKSHGEKLQQVIKSKFLLEARQVKLLGEIQQMFPISRLDNGEYAIRSLELNSDLSNNKDEDHVSSALGYVVHVVLLISKYLEVPLRYQLLFMGSRSLIRDAVGVSSTSAYPLFKRGVEKDRFEKALIWLKVDIEQLLSTRGVVYDISQSMLYNLAQLFESEKCPKLAF